MRPAHFPTVRFRQLAAILSNHSGWFTLLLESVHPSAVLATLNVEGLGMQTKHAILINAHIPLLYAYSILRQETRHRDKALRWLNTLPPENNHIIRRWRQLGLPTATAADTQALLELRKNYCSKRKCLDCAIGQTLMTTNAAPAPPAQAGADPPQASTGQ
jgi:hypothetical protein